jgi:O-antigen ligase
MLFGLVLVYLMSMLLKGVDPVQGLVGNYQRNFGIWYLISIALIFGLATRAGSELKRFEVALFATLGLALFYGGLQFFDLDPIPWRNPFDAVQLTLGNPNFSGALLGMLVVLPIAKLLNSKEAWERILFGAIGILVLGLALATKSLQAIVIAFISLLVLLIVRSQRENGKFWRLIRGISAIGSLITFLSILFVMFSSSETLKGIKERFYFQGSIPQRLDYWRTGVEMFKENPLFGVGPDQFQRYAAEFRNNAQILRDGEFVIPDRAHNVVIDHFANGGIFAGILWISFCVIIFWNLYQAAKSELKSADRIRLGVLGGIWSGYFLQSLLSPDQILLSVIGVMSAGFIVQVRKSVSNPVSNQRKIGFFADPIYLRTILGTVLAFAIFFWAQVLSGDLSAKSILENENIDPDRVVKSIDNWTSPKLIERITFAVAQADSNCSLVPNLADQMIESDNRSSSGWYFKAVCSNQQRKFDDALSSVKKSLEFDPLNPVYLVAKAKLAIAAGNKSEGMSALDILKREYPDNPEISPIESSLSFL